MMCSTVVISPPCL